MKYEVLVQLKQEVLDPEGRAIQETLTRHGHEGIRSVYVSKRFLVETEEGVRDSDELIKRVAEEYLANPVSETFEIKKVK